MSKIILSSAEAQSRASTSGITVTSRSNKAEGINKMHHTTFQARMGRRLDRISRRVSDNIIRLSSHPTDMIRISVERDPRSRDIVSRQITGWEIVPIILPPMKDVPLRHFIREGSEVQIPSLYTIDQQAYFEIYAPVEIKLEPEDFLFQIIYDPSSNEPYVMCLQVKEQLATIGYATITYLKYWVTFSDEKLPSSVIEVLKECNERRFVSQDSRMKLGW